MSRGLSEGCTGVLRQCPAVSSEGWSEVLGWCLTVSSEGCTGVLTGWQAGWLWLGPHHLPHACLRVLTAWWLASPTDQGGSGSASTVSHQGEAPCCHSHHIRVHMQAQHRFSVRRACTGCEHHKEWVTDTTLEASPTVCPDSPNAPYPICFFSLFIYFLRFY